MGIGSFRISEMGFARRAHADAGRTRTTVQSVPGVARKTHSDIMAGNLLVLRTEEAMRPPLDERAGRAAGFGGLKSDRGLVASGSAVTQVTLVGERQAVVGREFVYRGPQPECRECKVKAACLNQELGVRYRIAAVRDVSHPCLLNEERARVVEVEPAPPPCGLSSHLAVDGVVVAYERIVCANAACLNYRTCHPIGIDPGMRLRILEVGEELDCPLGYELAAARVAHST